MTDFCKNCNHILEITKTLPTIERVDGQAGQNSKELLNTATPEELSETEKDVTNPNAENNNEEKEGEDVEEVEEGEGESEQSEAEEAEDSEIDRDEEAEEFYEKILQAIENDQPLTNEELAQIDIKKMIKTDYYRGLKTKSTIKKKILGMIDDMGNSDENAAFYLFCSNCGYSRPLDPDFHILSMNPEGVASVHDYSDESKIRNSVHSGIYPRTREFTCPNKDCLSLKKGNPTEAVFMRDGDSYRMIYVCTMCLTIKRL